VSIHTNRSVPSTSSSPGRVGRKFLVVPALAVLLAIGCGDGDDDGHGDKGGGWSSGSDTASSTPTIVPGADKNQRWATGFCAAMTTFRSDIEELSTSVSFLPSDDAQKIQGTLVRFLQEAEKRSVTLQSDVRLLGDADGKDGKQIEEAMVAALGQAVTVFDKSVTDAQSLTTDDPVKFESEIAALGDSIDAASDDISSAFERIQRGYDTSELNSVLQSTSECRGAPF